MMRRIMLQRMALGAALFCASAGAETVNLDYNGAVLQPGGQARLSIDARVADPLPGGISSVTVNGVVQSSEGPAEGSVVSPVGPDIQAPELDLFGAATVALECGAVYSEPGARAVDDRDGDISANITVAGEVISAVPGDYTLTYSVADLAGNTAQRTREVVVADTTPPALVIDSPANVTICRGDSFTPPSATASDICAGELSEGITRTGAVDIFIPGIYELIYAVSDGVNATQRSVRVTVLSGGECPQECGVNRVEVITDADTYVFPPAAASRPVRLAARVVLLPEGLCQGAAPEVWFEVDGTRFDAALDEDGLYTAELDFDEGEFDVVAIATFGGGRPSVSSTTKVITVETAEPAGSAGFPADPAGALLLPGDRWLAEESSAACARVAAGIHLDASNVRTAPVLELQLPEPFAGTVTVKWPVSIVAPGESLYLFAAAACSPEALFFPASAGALAIALPENIDGAWPFVLVHAIAENAAGEVNLNAAQRFAQSPPVVEISGFSDATGQREAQGFGAAWSDSGGALRVSPGFGPWNASAASVATAPLGGLAFGVRAPGVFAVFESMELAELTVTPGGNEALVGIVPLGESVEVSFILSNTGGQPLAGRAFLEEPVSAAFELLDTAPYALEPGTQTTVRVRFTAIAEEDFQAVLRLTGDPAGARQITLRANVSVPDDKPNRFLGCGAGDGARGGAAGNALVAVLTFAAMALLSRRSAARRVR